MAGKTVLLLLANGAEEMEAVISIDVLRRASIEVVVASLNENLIVEGSRGINIKADKSIIGLTERLFDAVVLPGGLKGAENLSESTDVGKILKTNYEAGKLIAAICAAPTVLAAHGIATGKKVTCYPLPSLQSKMSSYTYCDDKVVKDENLITSRGPGTAFDFALEIVNCLCDLDTTTKLRKGLLLSS